MRGFGVYRIYFSCFWILLGLSCQSLSLSQCFRASDCAPFYVCVSGSCLQAEANRTDASFPTEREEGVEGGSSLERKNAERNMTCSLSQIPCDGACVDPRSSSQHCGRCDRACTSLQQCREGSCVQSCLSERDCSSGKLCKEGLCTSKCQKTADCSRGQVCRQGLCFRIFVPYCSALVPCASRSSCVKTLCYSTHSQCSASRGEAFCEGKCVLTHSDPEHCGLCGKSCSPPQKCVNGDCL